MWVDPQVSLLNTQCQTTVVLYNLIAIYNNAAPGKCFLSSKRVTTDKVLPGSVFLVSLGSETLPVLSG